MKISARGIQMPASPIRKLVPFAEEARSRGIEIFHLNIGQPDITTPDTFYEQIRKSFPDVVAYTHTAGIIELREAFCRYFRRWSLEYDPTQVVVTAGASEAIIFSLGAVADPGDEVIVIEPYYANYKGFASMLSINLKAVTSTIRNGYRLPPKEDFEALVSDRTRAVLFSHPSNPTGTVYTPEELERLVSFAKENDLFLIADEVYRELVFDGRDSCSIANFDDSERTIIIDSVSKRFSACGARIGSLTSRNNEVIGTCLKFAQARLCPPAIAQIGAVGLLGLPKTYTDQIRKEYENRRNVVFDELSKIPGVEMQLPEGALYISVKLPVDDAEDFVKWMLTDFSVEGRTVMTAPLEGFYETERAGRSEIRIAFVLSVEKLRDSCKIMRMGIEEYSQL